MTLTVESLAENSTIPHHYLLNKNINELVGNHQVVDPLLVNKVAEDQLKLINSEMCELISGLTKYIHACMEARDQSNLSVYEKIDAALTEIRDGCGDVIVTIDGFIHRLGLDYHFNTESLELPPPSLSVIYKQRMKVQQALSHAIELSDLWKELSFDSIFSSIHWLANILGFDIGKDQVAIYRSNMTKFDSDLETANAGVRKYNDLGVSVHLQPSVYQGLTYYIIRSSHDQVDINGKAYEANKFLKSIHFKEPVFEPIARPRLEINLDPNDPAPDMTADKVSSMFFQKNDE